MSNKQRVKNQDKNWTRKEKRVTKLLNDNEIEDEIEQSDDMFQSLEIRNEGIFIDYKLCSCFFIELSYAYTIKNVYRIHGWYGRRPSVRRTAGNN